MKRLIGISGRKRSGKDTVGTMIYRLEAATVVLAFATKIKEICKDVYDFSHEQVYGDLKEVPDPRYPRPDGTCLTPREAMERLGTEWGRTCYPDTWSAKGIRLAKQYLDQGESVVLTDCRFVSEERAIIGAGGEVWQVHRKVADDVPATHRAESEMSTPEFQGMVKHHLNNDGTMEDLRGIVREVLRGER